MQWLPQLILNYVVKQFGTYKIRVLPSGNLSQTPDFEKFCQGTSTVASVVNFVQLTTIATQLVFNQPSLPELLQVWFAPRMRIFGNNWCRLLDAVPVDNSV